MGYYFLDISQESLFTWNIIKHFLHVGILIPELVGPG